MYIKLKSGKPKDVGYYCPQPLLEILFSPFIRDRFDAAMGGQIGGNYATFYYARNGLYHLLVYLKRSFGCSRILLPSDICFVVKQASKQAGYKMLYYEGKSVKARRNDVLLVTDSTIKPPKGVFSIQDNAKNPLLPSKDFDFTLYSFGRGKPLASGGGGIVTVNNSRFMSFLKVRDALSAPGVATETKLYVRYVLFKFWSYGFLRKLAKPVKDATIGDRLFDRKLTNLNMSMPVISKKLISPDLP